jgi:hypothetical protein
VCYSLARTTEVLEVLVTMAREEGANVEEVN